jgi:HD-GYP domain-containing protein (c-di-GMP phosphodiesterase class II)
MGTTHQSLASLSFAELRDRLTARVNELDNADSLDLTEVLHYLVQLPISAHTADSIEALVQLARNFLSAARPTDSLEAASHAVRCAIALQDKALRARARRMEGVALTDLGRFAEAMIVNSDQLMLARELKDKKKEMLAISCCGQVCVAMGQLDAAVRYYERALELIEENQWEGEEAIVRNNLADCALRMRAPEFGLRALSRLPTAPPQNTRDAIIALASRSTLARLHLLVGDIVSARNLAKDCTSLSIMARDERQTHSTEVTLGLIDVCSGEVAAGLMRINKALDYARCLNQTDIADYLGACIDAQEAAGYPDRALEYLEELVQLKRKAIEGEVVPLPDTDFTELIQVQNRISPFDDGLLAKVHSLQTVVLERIQRLVEMAINAEIASGHDLYRTFRLGNLAARLAEAIGFTAQRVASLKLGAQLCNIGMIAMPDRILQKADSLSQGEHQILCDHTRFGGELLRKSKLRVLDSACVIAEQHHERYNGTGYPHGLKREEISEEARLVAICDAFDAMTHRRSRNAKSMSAHEALRELHRVAGSQLDGSYVEAFIDLIQNEIPKHRNLDAFLAEGAEDFEYVRARARAETVIQK